VIRPLVTLLILPFCVMVDVDVAVDMVVDDVEVLMLVAVIGPPIEPVPVTVA
jgi:hypothetical protein